MSFAIGQRVAVSGRVGEGTVRFTGNTQFSSGQWIGIELDAADGRNNGSVNGVVYFECAPNHGVFARPDTVRAADAPLRRSRRGSASRDDATGSTTASLAVQGQQVGRDIAAAHQDIARLEAQLAGMRDVALPRAPAAAAPPRTVDLSASKSSAAVALILETQSTVMLSPSMTACSHRTDRSSCAAENAAENSSVTGR